MKRYYYSVPVTLVEGSQIYYVDAESEAEAAAKMAAHDCEWYQDELEVVNLDWRGRELVNPEDINP